MPDGGSSEFVQFADCPICRNIPQKIHEDLQLDEPRITPPEAGKLVVVVKIADASTHQYSSSITRLLKCPSCGTYYYENRYIDEGEHFMDPTSNEYTLQRYDPVATLDFLEKVAAGSGDAFALTTGQFSKAFCEGTCAPDRSIAAEEADEKAAIAREEIGRLQGRLDSLIDGFSQMVRREPAPGRQAMQYAIEALAFHFALKSDKVSIAELLLAHSDRYVRVHAARLILGIGTGDASVAVLVHVPASVRRGMELLVVDKPFARRLVSALLEAALSEGGTYLKYDHGYGRSSYVETDARSEAQYGLIVAARHGVGDIEGVSAFP